MDEGYYRKTAALVGAMFIVATVTAIAAAVVLGDAFEEPDFMVGLPDVGSKVVTAALLELVLAISLIGIGALMFPVFKRHGEGLAQAYYGFRMTEAVCIVVATVSMVAMLAMGGQYADGDLDLSGVEAMGALLMGLREWAFAIGTLLFLGLGAMTLNYLFYVSRLIPRWLSVWGLIGGAGVMVYGVYSLYSTDMDSFSVVNLLAAPIAVQEMVFAVYLIVKGFTAPADVTATA